MTELHISILSVALDEYTEELEIFLAPACGLHSADTISWLTEK